MKKRILIIFTILVLVGILTTGLISLRFAREAYLNELETAIVGYARMTALQLTEDPGRDLQELTASVSGAVEARVTLIDAEGVVVGDSDASIGTLDNHGTRPEVVEALAGHVGTALRYSDTLGTDLFYVAYPALRDGAPLIIRVSLPLYEVDAFTRRLIGNYVLALVAGTLVAMILGLRFERYLVKPIRQLIGLTRRIADGNYGDRIYLDSDDEIRELSDSFNTMSLELKNKMNELDILNNRLQSILDSMTSGVIALDDARRVLFINPQAARMLELSWDSGRQRQLIEVLRNHTVYQWVEQYFEQDSAESWQQEIEYRDRFYVLGISPIHSTQDIRKRFGALVLIQDITDLKRLENMRKEFVANVSHELRTPLTSIRGFVETLRQGAAENPKTRERFLEILEIETVRLTRLIEDTLLLSDIESGRTRRSEPVPVEQSAREVLDMMQMTALQREIALTADLDVPQDLELRGNPSWFKQILINLIDNAIKYNRPNGTVRVRILAEDSRLVMTVEDTGIGISEAHLNRLFERFYRVDASRSKEAGGTGLGLAIVKHAALSFSGTVRIESREGEGTVFTVILPLPEA